MTIKFRFAIFFLAAVATASARTNSATAVNWSDTTRDVYVDNELDRDMQVLTADGPSRLALISSRLESAVVLNISERTVSTIPKEAFLFAADRASATSDPSAPMRVVGKFTRVEGPVYFFVVGAIPVLIRSHPGAIGEMNMDKLWETVPVWRSLMKNYVPSSAAVEKLKAIDLEARVTLAFGTWCPDSKNYMPRLIKALLTAGNPKIQVKLIGIDNQFREPVSSVQPLRITNVPTVIVERGGREIGRIVETPASKTIEEDLALILAGTQPVNNGRWDRGPKIASGVYSYLDTSGKQIGTESWELFSTAEGGHLVHSRVVVDGLITDVFHRVDANSRPSFVEVTKFHDDEVMRTRFTVDNTTMSARMRGNVSGVISQTLEVPERLFLSSPAIATQGFVQSPVTDRYQISSYVAPQEFDRAMGVLVTATCETKAEATVRVPAGEFRARHGTRKTARGTSEWWLHPTLGIPVRGLAGGIEYVLTSLELTAKQ